MKRFASYLPLVVVLALIVLAMPAFAQNETVMDVHLNKAAAIPGKVLAPGNYVFRLIDMDSVPKEVQVTTANGTPVAGFIPVYTSMREHAGNNVVKTTKPDQAGLVRITSWYFPGERYGHSFVYSKSDVRKLDTIAQKTHSQTAAGM